MSLIYLDNAATTPVFEDAARIAYEYNTQKYFNPSSSNKLSRNIKNDINAARSDIAEVLGVSSERLFFTSGATESNNWALECAFKKRSGNLIISAGEHSSVYECYNRFKSKNLNVKIAPLLASGEVNTEKLLALIDENTVAVSCMQVNNETGVINPIKSLTKQIKSVNPKILVHCDGAQGVLKTRERLVDLGVDFYTASAHKLCAPKGIGILYAASGASLNPYIVGGGQESGMRSGTENVASIMAFASAVKQYSKLFNREKMFQMRKYVLDSLSELGAEEIGTAENTGCILCLYIPDVKGQILMNMLADRGVIVGIGSACSGSKRGNRVLHEMGVKPKLIDGTIRISFSVLTEMDDVVTACNIIKEETLKLRSNNV